jgi:hypothetical protein
MHYYDPPTDVVACWEEFMAEFAEFRATITEVTKVVDELNSLFVKT